jgi:uncharacterized membrane protein YcfT
VACEVDQVPGVTVEAQEDHVASVSVLVGPSREQSAAALATETRAPSGPRVEWVDAARGIGIVLVVFAHDVRGLELVGTSPLATQVDRLIYAFHMPLFFFLAGLFARQSARRGARAFVTEKLRVIAYPYLLWSLLQGVLQVAMTSETNSHLAWRDLVAMPYQPIMQFWFLYTLFLVFILFLVCHRLRIPTWGILALGVGLSLLSSRGIPPRGEIDSLCKYFVYFALGLTLSGPLRRRLGGMRPLPSLVAGAAGFGVLAVLVQRFGVQWPLAVLAAAVGTMGTLFFAHAASAVPGLGLLRTLGACSLQIYVAHSIASAAVRIALHRAGVDAPAIQLSLGTAAGILAPLALVRLTESIGFDYLFCWPAPRRVAA